MRLPNIVIANGEQISAAVELVGVDKISVFGPAAVTGVVSIEVSPDGVNWYDTGSDVAANAVTTLDVIAGFVRVNSNAAEGAERVFPLFGSGPLYAA